MIKRILMFLLIASPVIGQDYRIGQSADSMKCNNIRSDIPDQNEGARPEVFAGEPVSGDTLSGLFQPQIDPRPAGFIDDSLRLFITWEQTGSEPSASGDTVSFRFFLLRRVWGEGTKNVGPSGAGESDWIDAEEGTATWGDPGAKNTSNDRQAVHFDTILVGFDISDNDTLSVLLVGQSEVNDFFDFGAVMEVSQQIGSISAVTRFHSDDHGTASLRPWGLGYHHSAARLRKRRGDIITDTLTFAEAKP